MNLRSIIKKEICEAEARGDVDQIEALRKLERAIAKSAEEQA